MKILLSLSVLFVLLSCNDGEFNFSSFEFEDEVNICGDQSFTLYRLSTSGKREVLMVTLTSKELRKDEDVVLPVRVSVNGDYTVTYRLFDSDVSSSYFCAVIPPVEPQVQKDWRGVSGSILVSNQPRYDDDGMTILNWEHIIVLKDVVFQAGDEELRIDDTFLFGTAVTGP